MENPAEAIRSKIAICCAVISFTFHQVRISDFNLKSQISNFRFEILSPSGSIQTRYISNPRASLSNFKPEIARRKKVGARQCRAPGLNQKFYTISSRPLRLLQGSAS